MKNTLIKFICLSFISIILTSNTSYAGTLSQLSTDNSHTIEYLNDNYYIETIITDSKPLNTKYLRSTSNTKTKTKTSYVKNSSGTVLWSVSITATFSYNGSTSKCLSCSHSTSVSAKTWSILSCTSSKTKNSATATAIAAHTGATASDKVTHSVTIKCSANGTVS